MVIEINDPVSMDVLIDNREIAGALDDLQRRTQVSRARNTGLRTSGTGVPGEAVPEVLVTFCKRPRLIRNFTVRRVHNDALRGRNSFQGRMPFDIHPGGAPSFPDAPEIRGLAIVKLGKGERSLRPSGGRDEAPARRK